jgi:hypothetical protein
VDKDIGKLKAQMDELFVTLRLEKETLEAAERRREVRNPYTMII